MSKQNKTVEEKMADLRELVAWFESDEFVLEEASARFKKASLLASEIERDLLELKNEIVVVKKSFERET